MPLNQMMHTALPLNRKERNYTGTIFPVIPRRDGFKHLHLLAKETARPRRTDDEVPLHLLVVC